MPSHKKFLEQVGFKQNSASQGYKAIKGYLKQLGQQEQETLKNYLYPTLDMNELRDQLEDLPTEELKKINPDQLKYKWVLRDVIKNRP